MITFLLEVLPQRPLERLGGAEEERLHRALRAAERLGHVAVGEAVDPREEQRRPLLRRQLLDRGFQLARQLAARRALLGLRRRGVGPGRAAARALSPGTIGSPGGPGSPTLGGAMRGRILREGTGRSQTRTQADTRPANTGPAARLRPPGPGRRLPWGPGSC